MKILFVATVARHILAFHLPYLQWFKSLGWEVHVATSGGEEISHCDIHHTIPISRSPFRLANLRAYHQLAAIICKEDYAIIHCHTPMGGMIARLAARRVRKSKKAKVMYTSHGYYFLAGGPISSWLLYYPIEKWLARYTDDLIVINTEDYTMAKKHMPAKRVHYVPGVGIDCMKFTNPGVCSNTMRDALNIPRDAQILLSIGELNQNKNHQIIIKAMKEINKNIYYVICGVGGLDGYLRDLAADLGLGNRLVMLGHRNDIADLLHTADVFVFPSLREGLPVSLMEAMAAGLPCVVSRTRGNVDLIDDGSGGMICDPLDASEFAKNIKFAYQNAAMGNYNKQAVQKFDIVHILEQMKKIYMPED